MDKKRVPVAGLILHKGKYYQAGDTLPDDYKEPKENEVNTKLVYLEDSNGD